MISDLKDVVNRTLFHLEQTREKFNQLTLGHLSPSVVASTYNNQEIVYHQIHSSQFQCVWALSVVTHRQQNTGFSVADCGRWWYTFLNQSINFEHKK